MCFWKVRGWTRLFAPMQFFINPQMNACAPDLCSHTPPLQLWQGRSQDYISLKSKGFSESWSLATSQTQSPSRERVEWRLACLARPYPPLPSFQQEHRACGQVHHEGLFSLIRLQDHITETLWGSRKVLHSWLSSTVCRHTEHAWPQMSILQLWEVPKACGKQPAPSVPLPCGNTSNPWSLFPTSSQLRSLVAGKQDIILLYEN